VKVLLDTHTLIWYYDADRRLSPLALKGIDEPANDVFVSPATYWEIAIKLGRRKLTLSEPYPDFVQHAILDNALIILPVELRHTAELVTLPHHHRDPFDRLIIAQPIVENMPLLSGDPTLDAYPVRRIW
jgi:PIN domain nuclease of toxin-antitoxin system